MTGRRSRLAPWVYALLLASGALLCGCGGGEETGSSTATNPAQVTTDAAAGQRRAGEPSPVEQAKATPSRGRDEKEKGAPPRQKGASGPPVTPPVSSAPQEGSTAAAPGVATVSGGDNSVQTYGTESDQAERSQAATTVQAYLDARAAGEWQTACSYLTAVTRSTVARYAERVGRTDDSPEGHTCAVGLKALTENIPASVRRQSAKIDLVLSFRIEGDQAFLLFNGPPKSALFGVPMNLEGGEWKVASLGPTPLSG